MVAVFADVETMVRADRQVVRIAHLPRPVAPRAPRIEQFPLGVEDLDAVVATVGDEEPVVFVDRQGPRLQELARLVAVAAPLAEPLPLGREDLDPVVLAILGDVEVARAVDHHVGRIAEPARRRPLHAVADLEQELAARANRRARDKSGCRPPAAGRKRSMVNPLGPSTLNSGVRQPRR